jgi:hypothetical protein
MLNKQLFTVCSYFLKEYIDLYVCFVEFIVKLHVWSFCNSELVSCLQTNVLPHSSATNTIYCTHLVKRGSFALSIGIHERSLLEIYMHVNVCVCNCMNFTLCVHICLIL